MSLVSPATGDYVVTEGRLARDPRHGLVNAIWFRLRTPLGSYWANASFGSELHKLAALRDVVRARQLAEQYARSALQDLVDGGRLTSVVTTATRPAVGSLRLHIHCVDALGEPLTLEHFVRVGV